MTATMVNGWALRPRFTVTKASRQWVFFDNWKGEGPRAVELNVDARIHQFTIGRRHRG